VSNSHPNGLARTPRAIEKAARLIAAGRVQAVPDAHVYLVQGDTGEYRVIADNDGIHCPCQARTTLCSHVLAVTQIRAGERAHELLDRPSLTLDELWARVGA
jgi:hypothetical protein